MRPQYWCIQTQVPLNSPPMASPLETALEFFSGHCSLNGEMKYPPWPPAVFAKVT